MADPELLLVVPYLLEPPQLTLSRSFVVPQMDPLGLSGRALRSYTSTTFTISTRPW